MTGSLHQKSLDVMEATFHGTKVVNLREWNFYKKIVIEMEHRKIWGYNIKAKNYLWIVGHCAGVTPRPTQK